MRLSTAVSLALTVLLTMSAVGAVAATPATGLSPGPGSPVPDGSPLESQPSQSSLAGVTTVQDADDLGGAEDQVIRLSIDESGDAHWTIETRFFLSDDEAVEDFHSYADAVAAGERDVTYDRQLFEALAAEAADRTDRSMAIRDAGWDDPTVRTLEDDPHVDAEDVDLEDADEPQVGVISYSVTWTNFAATENDRIYVGDAFHSDDGVWLSLTDTQRLVIERPDGYALDGGSLLEWEGPHEFERSELEMVFVQTGFSLGTIGWLLGVGALLIVAIIAGSYVATRRYPEDDLPEPVVRIADRVEDADVPERIADLRARVDLERGDSAATADTNGGSVPADGDRDERRGGTELEYQEPIESGIDPELLSDEERVLRLLKQNGGRMKQASIVEETGWSNAKVSQLLSQMDDDEEIEKLRIGRENLITLPDVDPTELD